MKRILVPNGNYTDIRLITAFKKMGFYVITSGNSPSLLGHKYADEYVPHDYSDYKGMLELARSLNIDYISACSNDFGVTTAAYIAENMGLPGHDTFEVARTIAEKDLFKKFAQANNLQVIPSNYFDDPVTAISFIKDAEYPIIVKPNDLGGGKGVSRADTYEDGVKAIEKAFDFSRSKHIVIEPYITGTQHSICTFLVNQKVKTFTSLNEYPCQNNEFLVGYGSVPASDMPADESVLIGQIEKMAELLHLADGIFHVQYRMHNGKPYIMECMRRCLGNYCLKATSDAINFPWEEWIAKAYCGMDCSEIGNGPREESIILHYYIQAPRNGIVKDIVIDDSIKPLIYDSIMHWNPGMTVEKYNVEMLGFLFLKLSSREQRDELATRIGKLVTVQMAE